MDDIVIESGPSALSRDEVVDVIRRYLVGTSVLRAILFGSFARGSADFGSDVDLLIVEETERPFVSRGTAHLPLLRRLSTLGVDLLVYTPQEYQQLRKQTNAFAQSLKLDGMVIYERQSSKARSTLVGAS